MYIPDHRLRAEVLAGKVRTLIHSCQAAVTHVTEKIGQEDDVCIDLSGRGRAGSAWTCAGREGGKGVGRKWPGWCCAMTASAPPAASAWSALFC